MFRARLACVVLLALASRGGAGESVVALVPATDAAPSGSPYRAARLTVTNGAAGVVQALSVQDVRGGVTILRQATVAPGMQASLLIPLPATSTEQAYRVRFLPAARADAAPLFETTTQVAWPGDVVEAAMASLVDPQAYDRLAGSAPVWPGRTRGNVFLLAALACLVLVATLFVPRPSVRLGVLLLLTVGGALAAAIALAGQDRLFVHRVDGIVAVSARRAADWSAHDSLVPIYAVKSQLAADTTVVGPGDMIQTTIRPEDMRLFISPAAPR